MTRSNTFIFVFAAVFAVCFITASSAQSPEFQQNELFQYLNSRYPSLYNRALRSMGKPTFIRFGKRSGNQQQQLPQQQQQQVQYPSYEQQWQQA